VEGELLSSSSADSDDKSESDKTYTEVFRESIPFYLNAGMTPEQFWDGDVELARDFRIAYWQRIEQQNEMLWLQGYYMYTALGAIMPATSVKFKAKQFDKYLEEPIPITKQAIKKSEERKAEKQMQKNLNFMLMFAGAHNSKNKDG
jgi:hypothetical protein